MLLNASGATGKTILRPSPTAVLKLRGGGLVPLRKLGTALLPVGKNLAAGWHGWCTLTAVPVAVSTVTGLTWLTWAARKPGSGRDLLRKLWRGSLAGITDVVKFISIGFPIIALCALLCCTLARDRSVSRESVRAAVTSQFTTSWSRLWNGFKFSSGIIGISLLHLAVPHQYQKILLVFSSRPLCRCARQFSRERWARQFPREIGRVTSQFSRWPLSWDSSLHSKPSLTVSLSDSASEPWGESE